MCGLCRALLCVHECSQQLMSLKPTNPLAYCHALRHDLRSISIKDIFTFHKCSLGQLDSVSIPPPPPNQSSLFRRQTLGSRLFCVELSQCYERDTFRCNDILVNIYLPRQHKQRVKVGVDCDVQQKEHATS